MYSNKLLPDASLEEHLTEDGKVLYICRMAAPYGDGAAGRERWSVGCGTWLMDEGADRGQVTPVLIVKQA